VLVALARAPVSDEALHFVLEELDTGVDPYLVAAAARALRSYPRPGPALAPFVMRAIMQIRYHDDPVSFEEYGEYSSSSATTPLRELFKTLAWLGSHARGVLSQLDALAQVRGLAKQARAEAAHALASIRTATGADPADGERCCELPPGLAGRFSWPRMNRRGSESIESVSFEDHDGASVTFDDVFRGHPSIVVFFYTRCDNPAKCPLTMYKFGSLQRLLQESELGDSIGTAAITYDPEYDRPERLLQYAQSWGATPSPLHRVLRTVGEFSTLREYFELGVNFGASGIVNRHRLEAFVLDKQGHIAHVVSRRRWDEAQLLRLAASLVGAPS
jgi:protein SCO1/2